MGDCQIILIDVEGNKRPLKVNPNQTLNRFFSSVNILTGVVNTQISMGDQIYGSEYNTHKLKDLGFSAGRNVDLMTRFSGAF